MLRLLFPLVAFVSLSCQSRDKTISPDASNEGTLVIGQTRYSILKCYLIEYTSEDVSEFSLLFTDSYLDTSKNEFIGPKKISLDVSMRITDKNEILVKNSKFSRCNQLMDKNCIEEAILSNLDSLWSGNRIYRFLNGVLDLSYESDKTYKISYQTIISSSKDSVIMNFNGTIDYFLEKL